MTLGGYSRRTAGAGLTHRGAYVGGRLPHPMPLDVFAANLALEYDSARGYTLSGSDIDSLACQRTGHVISAAAAANRPVYTASDADFAGFPSFSSSAGEEKALRSASAHGSDLIATGAAPYLAWLGKIGAPPTSANGRIFCLTTASSNVAPAIVTQLQTTGVLTFTAGGIVQTLTAPSQAVHLLEFIYDGTNWEYWVDGVFIEENAAGVLANEVRRVALGCRQTNTEFGNAEHNYFLATHAPITAAQRAALLPFWRARGAPV